MQKKYSGMEYEDVVKLFADDITKMCIIWTHNIEAAKDCFQNTFLKLYQTDKEFSNEKHIKLWLLRVAKNECNDYHRLFWNKNVDLREDIEQNFSETFNCDDETKELVYALQKLPLKYSCVITFYYYEGYKTAEIAKILGCSQNTVKSRLRRGRKYLADIMHDAEELL